MNGQHVCYHHGGNTPNALVAARQRLARAEVGELLGVPREVDPGQALLEAVYLSAGDVETLRLQLPDPDAAVKTLVLGDGVDVRVRMYHEAVERMAKLSKLAIDAGIAERVVRIREAEAAVLVAGFVHVLDHAELSLSGEQRRIGRLLARAWMLKMARSSPLALPEGDS